MKHFFILGNHPRLSLAEISSVLKQAPKSNFQNLALFDLKKNTKLQKLQKTLAGTIKIGKIIQKTTPDFFQRDILSVILKHIKKEQKINFGISAYSVKIDIKKIALDIKKKLKEKNIKSRWVQSREKTLSSVMVKTNKLLTKKGIEIVLFQDPSINVYPNQKPLFLLGITQTVQPFAEFSQRDYGRPKRDARSGMLPPKLARLMINLSQSYKSNTLLDPFCGSGTVLQEALLLGYKKIIGADSSAKAVNNSMENIQWLNKTQNSENPQKAIQFLHSEIRQIDKYLAQNSISAIITEPYLGPPLRGRESISQVYKILNQLTRLYLEYFQAFQKIIQFKGKIIIIFPIIQKQYLNILPQIQSMGFMQDKKFLGLYDNKVRKSFLYKREGQKVWREIFIFKKI